jgi:IclR family transcriptional regulator, acetate operon repressor
MKAAEQPLDRAFAVLGAVVAGDRALTITEIALQCNLPVPTVHRIVAQLEQRALLKRALGSKKVLVGATLVRLGAAAVAASTRSDEVHRILEGLANELGEHCQLGMRSGNDVVYSDTVRAARSTGLHFQQGKRAPLYCCSTGKLFLAEMEPEEFDTWLKSIPRQPLTRRTLVSERALRSTVNAARAKGWAASNEEMAAGVVGCAVPVRMSNGRLIAALGISVPSARMSFNELDGFRPSMQRTAAAIARAIEAS